MYNFDDFTPTINYDFRQVQASDFSARDFNKNESRKDRTIIGAGLGTLAGAGLGTLAGHYLGHAGIGAGLGTLAGAGLGAGLGYLTGGNKKGTNAGNSTKSSSSLASQTGTNAGNSAKSSPSLTSQTGTNAGNSAKSSPSLTSQTGTNAGNSTKSSSSLASQTGTNAGTSAKELLNNVIGNQASKVGNPASGPNNVAQDDENSPEYRRKLIDTMIKRYEKMIQNTKDCLSENHENFYREGLRSGGSIDPNSSTKFSYAVNQSNIPRFEEIINELKNLDPDDPNSYDESRKIIAKERPKADEIYNDILNLRDYNLPATMADKSLEENPIKSFMRSARYKKIAQLSRSTNPKDIERLQDELSNLDIEEEAALHDRNSNVLKGKVSEAHKKYGTEHEKNPQSEETAKAYNEYSRLAKQEAYYNNMAKSLKQLYNTMPEEDPNPKEVMDYISAKKKSTGSDRLDPNDPNDAEIIKKMRSMEWENQFLTTLNTDFPTEGDVYDPNKETQNYSRSSLSDGIAQYLVNFSLGYPGDWYYLY